MPVCRVGPVLGQVACPHREMRVCLGQAFNFTQSQVFIHSGAVSYLFGPMQFLHFNPLSGGSSLVWCCSHWDIALCLLPSYLLSFFWDPQVQSKGLSPFLRAVPAYCLISSPFILKRLSIRGQLYSHPLQYLVKSCLVILAAKETDGLPLTLAS